MSIFNQVQELLIPRSCAGCGASGTVLCGVCRHALREIPHLVSRPKDLGTPVFALGGYTETRRRLIIAMKEYNNVAVRQYVGAVVAAGITFLQARGEYPQELALVPAPTRPRSARLRGGDPVAQICQFAGKRLDLPVLSCLEINRRVADQSHLGAEERWSNMRGAVDLRGAIAPGTSTIVVDDVCTTGATVAASAAKLRGAGALVLGGLVLADAR